MRATLGNPKSIYLALNAFSNKQSFRAKWNSRRAQID